MSGRTTYPYRSIIKTGHTTKDDAGAQVQVEIAVWQIKEATLEPKGELDTKQDGRVQYGVILQVALGRESVQGVDPIGAEEIARRSALKSYRDEQGGRAPSTVRGYATGETLSNLPANHPVKRVLRRYNRSRGIGHQADGDVDPEAANPIDMNSLQAAYRLSRMICSKGGLGFLPKTGDGKAEENNQRIDYDEIRPIDEPLGDMKAAVMIDSQGLMPKEYEIDLDAEVLIERDGYAAPMPA